MRMIDADSLLGQAEHICSEEKYNFLKHWCDKQITAYDVDKVVQQIENAIVPTANHRHNFCGTVPVEHCTQYENCELCMADAIIKIVKEGGINQ